MKILRALTLCLALVAGAASALEPTPAASPSVVVQSPAMAAAATAAATPSAPSPAAPATPVTQAPSSAASLAQVVFGLLVVLGLLVGTLWFLKRMGGGRFAPGSVVKVIGGVSVGNRERVMVVEVAEQWIVIGVAPGRVNTLASMPRQEAPKANTAAGAPNFSAWLKQTIEKRNAN